MKLGTLPILFAAVLFGWLTIEGGLAAQDTSSEIAIFDAPGTGTAPGSGGTFPRGINVHGAIIGNYIDAHNVSHGFLRSPAGDKFVTFDAPRAGTAAGSGGTFPRGISDNGAIIGNYIDADNVSHGFLRSPAGDELLTFDAPGASRAAGSGGTFPRSITDNGAIIGNYIDAHNVSRGFQRGP